MDDALPRQPAELRRALSPLTRRLRAINSATVSLARTTTADPDDVADLIELLQAPLALPPFGTIELTRAVSAPGAPSPGAVLSALGIRLRARPDANGLPLWTLCRLDNADRWARGIRAHPVPAAVLEVLVDGTTSQEPTDPRYLSLPAGGGVAVRHLRLDSFRPAVAAGPEPDGPGADLIDQSLRVLGGLLAAAWHPDQHGIFSIAAILDLPGLTALFEVLHLAASADGGDLRSITPSVRSLLETVWPHDLIAQLLDGIAFLSGTGLDRLGVIATRFHRALHDAAAGFLNCPVLRAGTEVTLGELVLANYGRMAMIAPEIARSRPIRAARARLADQTASLTEAFFREAGLPDTAGRRP